MEPESIYIFDNDGTLYNCPRDFEKAITERMVAYIAKLCSISAERVLTRRRELFQRHSVRSTLLVFYYEGIIEDVDTFIQETYLSIDPRLYEIGPDLQLRRVLENLKSILYVHTNNPSSFADRILGCLGIRDLFSKIYGMFENDGYQKPNSRAFQNLLKDVSPYKTRWYVDNEGPNLIAAAQLGFKTIAVAEASKPTEIQVDRRLNSISELVSL